MNIITILLFSALSTISGCEKNTPALDDKDPSKKELFCKKWRIIQSIMPPGDTKPYRHDTINYNTTSEPDGLIIFNKDYTYLDYGKVKDPGTQKDSIYTQEGTWWFNEDSTAIAERVEKVNGKPSYHNDSNPFRWKILVLDHTRLTLCFQTRGGCLTNTYIPYEK